MTATLCPHGLTRGECLICATLSTSSADTPPASSRRPAAPVRRRGGGAGIVVAVVALLLVGWWVAALVSFIFRVVVLAAVSVGSGWIGWRLGVVHGRRTRRD